MELGQAGVVRTIFHLWDLARRTFDLSTDDRNFLAARSPLPRIRRTKYRDGPSSRSSGKMGYAAVITQINIRPGKQGRRLRQS
jgi:hypothetical protein